MEEFEKIMRQYLMMLHSPTDSGVQSSESSTSGDDSPTKGLPVIELIAEEEEEEDSCPDLFCQMNVLRPYRDDMIWKEMARWVKYEEAVEEGGKRWSKPHVSSLAMQALQDLEALLISCPVLLDIECHQMSDIVDLLITEWSHRENRSYVKLDPSKFYLEENSNEWNQCVNSWSNDRIFSALLNNHIRAVLLKQHKHQHIRSKDTKKSRSKLTLSTQVDEEIINGYENQGYSGTLPGPRYTKHCPDSPSLAVCAKTNVRFMRKIPAGSEAANLLIGEMEELDKRIAAFVRLKDAKNVGDISEVQVGTRFLFILLGPKDDLGSCVEIGRCMAALFTDEVFRSVAYKAKSRSDIQEGIEDFSKFLTVLPPSSWDPTTRIEPPEAIPSQEYRKNVAGGNLPTSKSTVSMVSLYSSSSSQDDLHEYESHCDPSLKRTGRLFGGLIDDIKRKAPWYISDFKDCMHIQCLASFIFLFLATLTPNVTFGGLLGQATDQYMGTMECILAAAVTGVVYALFSGQPLNILGSTGPMLILEAILFRFCKDYHWDFLPFRVWVGFWTALFILLIVAFDLSALVRYITRFTEESFACLIALIFIYEAFKKTIEIQHKAPVEFNPSGIDTTCICVLSNSAPNNSNQTTLTTLLPNSSSTFNTSLPATTTETVLNVTSLNITALRNVTEPASQSIGEIVTSSDFNCTALGGELVGNGCGAEKYVPDVFFFSVILFVGTFSLAWALKNFKTSLFFPSAVRHHVSDFSVLIAIILMVLLDYFIGIPTPKLTVPSEFKPTRSDRGWFISPYSDTNPWWLMLLSSVPALLATILIFMDQQITAVIVNRKENKLQKGVGYHLDMLVVGVLVVVLSLLGLPWYVAATVTALAHVMSLKKESGCTAPGEKPMFLGVREQRVTGLLVGIFSGLAVLITSVLKYIPMPVLYGVFLYMGIAALNGMQLVQRVMILFMPQKYQPDYSFLRHVPLRRVHLFTAIQVFCLAVLWIVKSIKLISIGFPIMVLFICFIRKALDRVFSQRELRWIDDVLPSDRKPIEDKTQLKEDIEAPPEVSESRKPSSPRRSVYSKKSIPQETDEGDAHPLKVILKPRYSCPFVCKTDLDNIKITCDVKNLQRKISQASATDLARRERKISLYTMFSLPTTVTNVSEYLSEAQENKTEDKSEEGS